MVRELHAGLVAMLLLSTCCCTPAFIHTVHRAGGRPCWHVAPRTRADAVATCRAARIAPGAAQRWVCLHNDSRRPPEEERFCLPHSRFEGRFVPVNEQMTFQAEMEALDALDEAESKLASQPDDFEAKFDENGDVTVGLFYRGSRGWSKKSVEARMRWNDPAYRKKVIRKREARLDEDDTAAMVEPASPARIERQLPQLHDLLKSDAVAWSPEHGGWAGAGEGLDELPSPRIGSFVGGRTGKPSEGGSPDTGDVDHRGGAGHLASVTVSRSNTGSTGGRSEGMQRKIKNLKLLHADQNEWIERRLGKEDEAPSRGSVAWRLEKQARYKAAALKRERKKRAQSEAATSGEGDDKSKLSVEIVAGRAARRARRQP